MRPESLSIRFIFFRSLLMVTTLNSISADPPSTDLDLTSADLPSTDLDSISADPPSTDLFALDDLSIESNPDELSLGIEQPGSLPFDISPDSSFLDSGLSDSSDIDATGSSIWNDYDDASAAADLITLDSSCQMGDNFLFDDDSLTDDGILQARNDDAAMCSNPEKDQAINSDLDLFRGVKKGIPPIFSPNEITKPTRFGIPPDPVGSFIKEYSECFLPYLYRCCCKGPYAWAGVSLWGNTLQYIWQCSVGMYASLHDPTIPIVRLVD